MRKNKIPVPQRLLYYKTRKERPNKTMEGLTFVLNRTMVISLNYDDDDDDRSYFPKVFLAIRDIHPFLIIIK